MIRVARVQTVLAFAVITTAALQDRSFMSAELPGTKATVMILGEDVTLKVESAAGVRMASVGKGWTRVLNVRFSPDASRLAIVANDGAPLIAIVDATVPYVLATHKVGEAAISPDGRAVVFEHARGAKDEPGRASLIALGSNDPTPMPFTLGGRGDDKAEPVKASTFQWTDPEVVAFVVHGESTARVVAAQFDGAGKIQRTEIKPLPLDEIVDIAKIAQGTVVSIVTGARITRVPSAGLTLRLELQASPALRVRTTDVRMW